MSRLTLQNVKQLTPKQIGLGVLAIPAAAALVLLIFNLIFAGRVLPGVVVNGQNIGGQSVKSAQIKLNAAASNYQGQQIKVVYGTTALQIPVSSLGVTYGSEASRLGQAYGRSGGLFERWHAQARSLLGRQTAINDYQYNSGAIAPFVSQVDSDVTAPVANASLSFDNGEITVTPSQPGRRLDRGQLILMIEEQLADMQSGQLTAPVYNLTPTVNEAALGGAKSQARAYVSAPLVLSAAGQKQTVTQDKILGWLNVTSGATTSEMPTELLTGFYVLPTFNNISLTVDQKRVGAYVADLAGQMNRQAQDAELSMDGGTLNVAVPSHDGLEIDQAKATEEIIAAAGKGGDGRTVALTTKVTKAAVNEANLPSLGIKEPIGQGFSTFPGSSSARLTNVRVGQALYNNVLIKPGEVFSFGAKLGEVGPAQGYQPSLVIIGNKEEKQYGGGLCQVSSTLYRAALTAGLPIVQRTNHAFAINEFYTAPYGVPGVDATVYYPAVDLKFKNDTPAYILIQTKMVGTTLTFNLFGTKTKSGVIRGPQFISGSMDATQPSHTVFYRDVLDLNGNVVKTDTVHTYYKASTDFTISDKPQFN